MKQYCLGHRHSLLEASISWSEHSFLPENLRGNVKKKKRECLSHNFVTFLCLGNCRLLHWELFSKMTCHDKSRWSSIYILQNWKFQFNLKTQMWKVLSAHFPWSNFHSVSSSWQFYSKWWNPHHQQTAHLLTKLRSSVPTWLLVSLNDLQEITNFSILNLCLLLWSTKGVNN